MNIFARRAAASEGAFFSQASKESIVRLREKTPRSSAPAAGDASSTGDVALLKDEVNPDVLPEILQHSLPKHQQYDPLPTSSSPSPSSLVSLASAKPSNVASRHRADNNGLAFLPTLPQASFGPRRWKVTEEEVKLMASTANEARFLDDTPTMDDAKAKALVEGYGVSEFFLDYSQTTWLIRLSPLLLALSLAFVCGKIPVNHSLKKLVVFFGQNLSSLKGIRSCNCTCYRRCNCSYYSIDVETTNTFLLIIH
ncbi:hypothetical protein KP509_12G026200 [Ceratopteris richardii]|uniref:Uncharacterized protein n=1 Tax=Ceratopteris richardii TaxID=49495 RepID=A0A8T2TQG5_CERRI|nr:hypothetical protein KP509_12G026200 [Ceratopteris richardii]